jgi:dihydrofolate reductase
LNEINNLKNQIGGDIIAYGGAQFVSSLIKHNLIDEYHLMVNPTVIGKGMPIFNELTQNLQLELK